MSEVKARDIIIGRQMAKCGATEDTLEADNFKEIAHRIAGAAGLYVADPPEEWN